MSHGKNRSPLKIYETCRPAGANIYRLCFSDQWAEVHYSLSARPRFAFFTHCEEALLLLPVHIRECFRLFRLLRDLRFLKVSSSYIVALRC